MEKSLQIKTRKRVWGRNEMGRKGKIFLALRVV